MTNPCVIVIGHISSQYSLDIAKICLTNLKKYGAKYPLIFATSVTDMSLITSDVLKLTDHSIVTTHNPLITKEEPHLVEINSYHASNNWIVNRRLYVGSGYYGYSQLFKINTALEYAQKLGHDEFLVVNYDAIIMDTTFFDDIFDGINSVFIVSSPDDISTDVMKLNNNDTNIFKLLSDKEEYTRIQSECGTHLLEPILKYVIDQQNPSSNSQKFWAINPSRRFRIPTYNIMLSAHSTWNYAYAFVQNNLLNIVVDTGNGIPAPTTEDFIEIGYNDVFTKFDVTHNQTYIHPLGVYEGKDVHIVVRSVFGELAIPILAKDIENTHIQWNNGN